MPHALTRTITMSGKGSIGDVLHHEVVGAAKDDGFHVSMTSTAATGRAARRLRAGRHGST
jgi:hypothetical protein